MHRFSILLISALVCLASCSSPQSKFEQAFSIKLPTGLVVRHEYLFSRGEYTAFLYAAILDGDREAFIGLVRQLGLQQWKDAVLAGRPDALSAVFEPLAESAAPWWNPPSAGEQEASEDSYFRRDTDPAKRQQTTIVAQYSGTNIYLWKKGLWPYPRRE